METLWMIIFLQIFYVHPTQWHHRGNSHCLCSNGPMQQWFVVYNTPWIVLLLKTAHRLYCVSTSELCNSFHNITQLITITMKGGKWNSHNIETLRHNTLLKFQERHRAKLSMSSLYHRGGPTGL